MSETEEKTGLLAFVGRNRAGVIAGVIAVSLAALLFYALINTSVQPQVKQAPPPIQVQLVHPKPPPPPPPPTKIPQEKPITPQKTPAPTPKPIPHPAPPKPATPRPSPPALGTSINNGKSDGFAGLANGGGDGMVGGTGDGGGGGSFAAYVTAEIESALSRNPKTKNANAGLVVNIWLNAAGTVTRVEIVKSSGDATVDEAVKNEVLPGMNFTAPPPGTGMPISMSLTGQQPL
jgi:TonB family protein